jgi:hypothetical protein
MRPLRGLTEKAADPTCSQCPCKVFESSVQYRFAGHKQPCRDRVNCLLPGNALPLALAPLSNSLQRIVDPIGMVDGEIKDKVRRKPSFLENLVSSWEREKSVAALRPERGSAWQECVHETGPPGESGGLPITPALPKQLHEKLARPPFLRPEWRCRPIEATKPVSGQAKRASLASIHLSQNSTDFSKNLRTLHRRFFRLPNIADTADGSETFPNSTNTVAMVCIACSRSDWFTRSRTPRSRLPRKCTSPFFQGGIGRQLPPLTARLHHVQQSVHHKPLFILAAPAVSVPHSSRLIQ